MITKEEIDLCTQLPMYTWSEWGYNEIKKLYPKVQKLVDPVTDTEGLIFQKDSTLFISFRATEMADDEVVKKGVVQEILNDLNLNSIDWFMNLLFRKVEFKEASPRFTNIKVHRGFAMKYFGYIRYQIYNFINEKYLIDKQDPITSIVVTGHSQGAAIAQVCALDLGLNFFDNLWNIVLVSFASPRVGNKQFIDAISYFTEYKCNFYYGQDIIPLLPPKLFGFSDLCNTVHFPKEEKKKSIFTKEYWNDFVIDHSIHTLAPRVRDYYKIQGETK
jgi:predicted lipase